MKHQIIGIIEFLGTQFICKLSQEKNNKPIELSIESGTIVIDRASVLEARRRGTISEILLKYEIVYLNKFSLIMLSDQFANLQANHPEIALWLGTSGFKAKEKRYDPQFFKSFFDLNDHLYVHAQCTSPAEPAVGSVRSTTAGSEQASGLVL